MPTMISITPPKEITDRYDILNESLVAKEKSFAETEIGDREDSTTFQPQLKIKRWENESNFSLRLDHSSWNGEESLTFDKHIIRWTKGTDLELWFYDLGDFTAGYGYEFEVHLKKKPKTNILPFTLKAKEVKAYYQPPLTPFEIARGNKRDPDIVGSYAFYHPTKSGNYEKVGGKNYKIGKLFHLYRPQAEDAVGAKTWCDLHIDITSESMTITVPQTFLDNVVYPVVIDPTFGFVACQSNNDSTAAYTIACKFNFGGTTGDIIDSFHSCCDGTEVTAETIKHALYADDGGSPAAKIEESSDSASLNDQASRNCPDSTIHQTTGAGSPAALVNGTDYWLAEACNDGASAAFFICYDSGDANQSAYVAGDLPFPNPFNEDGLLAWKISIYATYSTPTPPAGIVPQAYMIMRG